MIPAFLGLLKWAPAVLGAGREIVGALSGSPLAEDAPAEEIAAAAAKLPAEQQAQVMMALIDKRNELERLDTERFVAMASADAETQRASARPEIALRAMSVIEIFSKLLALVFLVTVIQWAIGWGYAAFGAPPPAAPSFWEILAQAAPVTELIWAPLIASFWCCVQVIKTYFGCRERDKARMDEIQYGAPLTSTQATVAAAGSGVAEIIRAFKGK